MRVAVGIAKVRGASVRPWQRIDRDPSKQGKDVLSIKCHFCLDNKRYLLVFCHWSDPARKLLFFIVLWNWHFAISSKIFQYVFFDPWSPWVLSWSQIFVHTVAQGAMIVAVATGGHAISSRRGLVSAGLHYVRQVQECFGSAGIKVATGLLYIYCADIKCIGPFLVLITNRTITKKSIKKKNFRNYKMFDSSILSTKRNSSLFLLVYFTYSIVLKLSFCLKKFLVFQIFFHYLTFLSICLTSAGLQVISVLVAILLICLQLCCGLLNVLLQWYCCCCSFTE